jgi:hypothetical protein
MSAQIVRELKRFNSTLTSTLHPQEDGYLDAQHLSK